jgi:alpha-amylase/alpha-mannosidase (GH57 family)
MTTITTAEIIEVLSVAKNLNAALKNLMKREGGSNPAVAAFAKEFRSKVGVGRLAGAEGFIDKCIEKGKEGFFFGVARYAFADVIDMAVEQIIERYADEFNATYERTEQGIGVKNSERFREIASDVSKLSVSALTTAEVPVNSYSRGVMLATVFEADVLEEVQKYL